MANPFYYGDLSDTVSTIRNKIAFGYKNDEGTFIKGIIPDEHEKALRENKALDSELVQSRIYARILNETGSELEKLKNEFFTLPFIREPILIKYTNQIVRLMAEQTGMQYKTALAVTAKNNLGGEVKTQIFQTNGEYWQEKEVDGKLKEQREEARLWRQRASDINTQTPRGKKRLERLIESYNKSIIIPFFEDPADVETVYTSMNIGFFHPHSDSTNYYNALATVSARVKRNKRELKKFLQVLFGLEKPYYDGIGTIQVVPQSLLIRQLENIIACSDKTGLTARIKGLVRDGTPVDTKYSVDDIKEAETNRALLRRILADKELWTRVYADQDRIVKRIQAESPTKPVSKHDKDALLTGVWIRHDVGSMHVSSILQSDEMHRYYKIGPINHTQYEREREREEEAKLEAAMIAGVVAKVEKDLENIFEFPSFLKKSTPPKRL